MTNNNTTKPRNFTGGVMSYNAWNRRPADQRYETRTALLDAADALKASTKTGDLRTKFLPDRIVETPNGGLGIQGGQSVAPMSHWAFGQLSGYSGSPASFLRKLTPGLAIKVLDERLRKRADFDDARLQCVVRAPEGTPFVGALLSESYYRESSADFLRSLFDRHAIEDRGWRYQAGHVSDRNCFAFLVADDIGGGEGGRFRRGLIAFDSDVGERSRGLMSFTFDYMCMNSLIGIRDMELNVRLRHTSEANLRKFDDRLARELDRIEGLGFDRELEIIRAAEDKVLGETIDAAVEAAAKTAKRKGLTALTQGRIARSVALAERFADRYGDPRTAWAVAGGLTQDSQTAANTDTRMEVDRQAGRLLRALVA